MLSYVMKCICVSVAVCLFELLVSSYDCCFLICDLVDSRVTAGLFFGIFNFTVLLLSVVLYRVL